VRLVFLSLIVVNLAFFGWARWVDSPPQAANAAIKIARDADIPPLQLVSPTVDGPRAGGAPAAGSPAAGSPAVSNESLMFPGPVVPAATDATVTAAATPMRCRSLGPFEDSNSARAAAARLRERGWIPRERSAETNNPNIYWVYIGELTADMQRRAIATLSSAGIHDAAPMTQPEQSDRISVGVFADQAHAVRRAEQVRALGLRPTLGMRQRVVNAHWLDFDLKATDTDPAPTELLGTPVRATIGIGPVKIGDCPAGSSSG
jgi:hypothetical protein